MAKLQDLFTQARRTQSASGMGFLGKNKAESKPHAAALVVEFTKVLPGSAESALKAGADGLLFNWDGEDATALETLKTEIESLSEKRDILVTGLRLSGNWDELDREQLLQLKEQGINYIVLPFNAPARLLGIEAKDMEKVVTVPMREGDFYPLYIHNLSSLEGIAAVLLDFGLTSDFASISIENVLNYRAVREAVRFPAFIPVKGDLSSEEAHTLRTLGVQALQYTVNGGVDGTAEQQIKSLRTLLEELYEEEKDKDNPSASFRH